VGLNCLPATSSSTAAPPGEATATDIYNGSVIIGPGSYSHAPGDVQLVVWSEEQLAPPFPRHWAIEVLLRGRCVAHSRRRGCLLVEGAIHGEATEQRDEIPDFPGSARLSGSGHLVGVGVVTATAEFQGTGFVPRGQLTSKLHILTPSGSIWVIADGPLVSGFSPPLGCSTTSCAFHGFRSSSAR